MFPDRSRQRVAIALLAGVVSFGGVSPGAGARPDVRAVFVTGGGTYDNSIFGVVQGLAGIAVTVVESDREAFMPGLEDRVDVVVLYNVSRTLPEAARATLRAFVEGGGGVVVLHHALASYGDWPWWWREVTGGRYVLSPEEGLAASRYSPNESIIAIPTGEHPITEPLGGQPIHLTDETYEGLWLSPEIEVLLRTGLSSSDGPLLWLGPHPGDRVVVFQSGHASSAHYNLGFRVLLRRSILWASGRLPEATAEAHSRFVADRNPEPSGN